MKITANFSLSEFASRDGVAYPDEWVEERLRPLCAQLETIRAELGGHAVTIDSGFRTESYNQKIGGAKLSQHVQGRAADIVVAGFPPDVVHSTILKLYSVGMLKIGGLGKYLSFVHIDVRPSDTLVQWTGTRVNN